MVYLALRLNDKTINDLDYAPMLGAHLVAHVLSFDWVAHTSDPNSHVQTCSALFQPLQSPVYHHEYDQVLLNNPH